MKVVCPQCSSLVPTSDLNMFQMAAKCLPCNSVFDFTSQLDNAANVSSKTRLKLSPEVMRPQGIKLIEEGEMATLVWRPAIRFTLMRIVFILFMVSLLAQSLFLSTSVDLWQLDTWFLSLMILWFTYQLLVIVVNRNTIKVSETEVTVFNEPLPPKTEKKYSLDKLAHLYVREVSSERIFRRYSYEILGIDPADDIHRVIVRGFDSHDHAQYVRQELERRIGIRAA